MVQEKLGANIGREIELPNGTDTPQVVQVTMSGLLGIVSRVGLKGAQRWLENPADRERFPNTTLAFRQFNGDF
jgi:hypothetical protein